MKKVTVLSGIFASVSDALAADGGGDGAGFFIWGFLALCALIIVGQVIPALRGSVGAAKEADRKKREEPASWGSE